MRVTMLLAMCALLVSAACLAGCQGSIRQSTKPTPPLVTDCLEAPQGVFPPEPKRPAEGDAITDRYVSTLIGWGNRILGIATDDRIKWRGERRCIRKIQQDGQIR
jgi:hypothetical protein